MTSRYALLPRVAGQDFDGCFDYNRITILTNSLGFHLAGLNGVQRCCVTGGAGFIGSTLADRLLALGHHVTIFDNFSTGRPAFIEAALPHPACSVVRGDLSDHDTLVRAMRGCALVFHLAANADVRWGSLRPRRDLRENTLGTANVLAAAAESGITGIVFTSTGSVYGEPSVIPTPEDAPFPVQTSLYGAAKLAGEGLIQAYAAAFGIRAWIFRLVSVLGARYPHGHVIDFCRQLRREPTRLAVLGDGTQRKSYVHVDDCIEAILHGVERGTDTINIFNVGTDETCDVRQSIGWISARLGLAPVLEFGGGPRGWVGDSPHIHLDTARLRALGWMPRTSIKHAVEATVDWIRDNPWILDPSRESHPADGPGRSRQRNNPQPPATTPPASM